MKVIEAIRVGLAIRRLHRRGLRPILRFSESRCGEGWVVIAGTRPYYHETALGAVRAAEEGERVR